MTTTTPAALTTDIEKLEDLARAATKGPWMRLFGERTVYDRMNDGCRGNAIVRADTTYSQPDAANLDFIAAANPAAILELIALARSAHIDAKLTAASPAVPMTADELAALRRFDECAQDGEGYDVPREMMQRLAEIGVIQRRSGAYYQATDFGQHVLGNAPSAPYFANDGREPDWAAYAAAEAGAPNLSELVNRFLGWPLPAGLLPNIERPIGTHLLNADQARAMFEYVLAARFRAEGGNTSDNSNFLAAQEPAPATQQGAHDELRAENAQLLATINRMAAYHREAQKTMSDDETARWAERHGASVEWANDADMHHIIKMTPPDLRHILAATQQAEPVARDQVLRLLNHIEDVVDDANWERISAPLWNAVTQRISAPVSPSPAAVEQQDQASDERAMPYGATDFGYTFAGIELEEGDKRLAALIVNALGTAHPAMDDFVSLLFRCRSSAPAPKASGATDKCAVCDGNGREPTPDEPHRRKRCVICNGTGRASPAATEASGATVPDADAKDAARLDWLNKNFFSDQKDEWDERLAPDCIKWKFFGPLRVQGDIRLVIDAAIAAAPAAPEQTEGK